MIQFDNNTHFTFSVIGGKEEHILTIKALLDAISVGDNISNDSRYYLCELIRGLVPNPRQIVSMEEVEELERIKSKNVELINTIIE